MDNVITIKDRRYPILLKKIGKDAPRQLYYKGNWEDIFPARAGGENCLAVVGSRRMTTYGKQATEKLVKEIAAAGVIIVSGFMYGVDATAHKAALSVGGKTIAVMPCGIDLIHPEYQSDLYNEILENGGLVISEYDGNMQPSNWTYPRRNRIVAGLAMAALIVEAGERSGSLITANFAKKFKRKLFAVPGPITSMTSKGTLQLIKNGAEIATDAKEILDFYGIRKQNNGSPTPINMAGGRSGASLLGGKIIECLQREPLEIDALARELEMSVSQIGTALSMMQLQGLIVQEGNKFYVRQ